MAITLTSAEIQSLANKEVQAQSGQLEYWKIYQWLGDLLQEKGIDATDSTLLWLRGATEANAGRGAMASLIRTYTETQYQLRYGTSIPPGKMQEASNAVAQNLFDDLLGRNEPRWPVGQIPDIARIGEADATAVGRILFNVDLADTGAALQQNSAWSGTLLFSLLRSDQTNRLSSTGTLGKIDTLNDWRDVLYSYNAYAAGFKAAQSTLLLESAAQAKVDETVFGATTWGYLKTPESVLSLKDAVILGTDNPVLKAAFAVIGDVGPHKFLDMLMGAVQGKNLIGTTKDDVQFATNARNFLGALSPTQLQSLKAELLPQSASAVAGKAMANTPEGASARAALAALSMVSVQVSPEVAARVALYDPATGTGQLSESWIADRAAFTTRYYEQQQRGGGILQGSQNVAYIEMGNGGGSTPALQVLVGAGSAQRTQYVFGGSGDDQINGQGFSDHLYGGAGADTLDGKGGADYLEGGAGKSPSDNPAGKCAIKNVAMCPRNYCPGGRFGPHPSRRHRAFGIPVFNPIHSNNEEEFHA